MAVVYTDQSFNGDRPSVGFIAHIFCTLFMCSLIYSGFENFSMLFASGLSDMLVIDCCELKAQCHELLSCCSVFTVNCCDCRTAYICCYNECRILSVL